MHLSLMPSVELDTHLKAWGNSFGILVPADIARRLQAEPGAKLHVVIQHDLPRNDASRLPSFHWGGTYDIDEVLAEDLE